MSSPFRLSKVPARRQRYRPIHSINFRNLARDPYVVAVTGVLVAAAALRFSTLSLQSYYTDEATTVWLLQQSPIDMVHGIARTQSSPPLYFGVARVWSGLFGTSEVGLRSLSALLGTATVLVAYLAGARLLSRRAGLVVAALTAVSPFMVWYSQEARNYALFTFLATLSIYLYACLRGNTSPALVVAWAAVCEAAIWTHHFAVYLVATEALLLLLFVPRARRAIAAASVAITLAAVPVAALAIHQAGALDWLAQESPLRDRVFGAGQQFLAGHYQLPHPRLVAALLAVVIVLLLAGARSRAITSGLAAVAVFGAALFTLPLVAAALGKDYWLPRNVMPAWICAAMIVAVAVTTARPRWLTWLLATALVLLSLVPTLETFARPEFQRANWRGLARCLGAPRSDRVVVLPSEAAALALGLYRPGMPRLGNQAKLVDEVDVISPANFNFRVPAQFASARASCGATLIPFNRYRAQKEIPVSTLDFLRPSRSSDAQVRIDPLSAEMESGGTQRSPTASASFRGSSG